MDASSGAWKLHQDISEPELHIIGELIGGEGFDSDNAFAAFEFRYGKEWTLVGGETKGQTQVDYPYDSTSAVWNHPIDLHFYSRTLQGWPRIILELFKLDQYGGKQLFGYGFTFVPTTPGSHEVEMDVWRPCGTPHEEVYDFFLGGVPNLLNTELLHSAVKAKEDRCHLFSKSIGKIIWRLDIILRNMTQHGIVTM